MEKSGTENKENGEDNSEKLPEVTNQNATSINEGVTSIKEDVTSIKEDVTSIKDKEDVNKIDGKDVQKEKLSDVVDKIKESSSNHRNRIKSISKKYESEKTRRRTPSYHR